MFPVYMQKEKKTEYENSFHKISNGTKQNMTIQVFMIEKNHDHFLIEDRKIAKQKKTKQNSGISIR